MNTTNPPAAPTPYLPMRYQGVDRAALEAYGQELAAAGFNVWLSPFGSVGYLIYELDGNYGTLQCSEFEGWKHSMPIKPSRKDGSSITIKEHANPFTVGAARETARPTNRGLYHGGRTFPNPREHWKPADAYPITAAGANNTDAPRRLLEEALAANGDHPTATITVTRTNSAYGYVTLTVNGVNLHALENSPGRYELQLDAPGIATPEPFPAELTFNEARDTVITYLANH